MPNKGISVTCPFCRRRMYTDGTVLQHPMLRRIRALCRNSQCQASVVANLEVVYVIRQPITQQEIQHMDQQLNLGEG